MKVKGIILLILCLVGMNTFSFAQQNSEKRKAEFEAFKAKRVAYITQEMNLTAEESQDFWPLCNELQEKKFELNKTLRTALKEFYKAEKEGQKNSEADYKKTVNLGIETREKEIQLEKEYLAKFGKVISAEKVFKYQRAEQHFARKMLEEREKRDGRKSDREKRP